MGQSVFVTATVHVESFDHWKPLFDEGRDNRQGYGAVRHWMHRAVDDPSLLMITVEFPTRGEAEKFRDFLQSDEFAERTKDHGVTAMPSVHLLQDFEEHDYA